MRRLGTLLAALLAAAAPLPALAAGCSWQAAWASAQMTPGSDTALPPGALTDATLRQMIRPMIGGARWRVRISNAFGKAPLAIAEGGLAKAADFPSARIDAASARALTFAGRAGATIPVGGEWLSDPVALPLPAFADVAISLRLPADPAGQTGHPGSRGTSYIARGGQVAAADLSEPMRVDHWYLLAGLEVERCAPAAGIVALGDSITDGYGIKPNSHARWPDYLGRRLGGRVAILNQGIGGNRILADGTGPSAIARLDRDVLSQPGIRHLILFEGVNDLGGLSRQEAVTPAQHRALVEDLTAAIGQIVARARARGLSVHVATILPFAGSNYYHVDAGIEADRNAVNAWIRTPGNVDTVIDLDKAMHDPARPTYLAPRYDSGDGLHPNDTGLRAIADLMPLARLR